MKLLIKQCTNLQSFDASIYTIIGILSPNSHTIIKDIDSRNSGFSYTMTIDHEEVSCHPFTFACEEKHEMLKIFLKNSGHKDILLFSDGSLHTESTMTILIKLCLEANLQPLLLIGSNAYSENAQERFLASKANILLSDEDCHTPAHNYENAMKFNHMVTKVAHSSGFDSGLSGAGYIYDYAKEIMAQEVFDRYHFSSCIDDRGLLPFWTPWSSTRTNEEETFLEIDF